MKKGSVGTIQPQFFNSKEPLVLESGEKIENFTIAYETYGHLNADKSNAILICHALSGDAHAAGFYEGDTRPGWWDIVIGPGKAFDTDKYFIISSNIIGGCKGSTGPSSVNPITNKPYGLSFPVITIGDMVNAQRILIRFFGIERLYAVAGGSMGGMQVLSWTVQYPENVKKAIVIASTAYSTPQQIAFNEVGRNAIYHDPLWKNGDYYGSEVPANGLGIARMIGHITYLSDESMHSKFGRKLQGKEALGYNFATEFQVESYLQYQGNSFTKRFDANSYLYISKAIDYFDLAREGSLSDVFTGVQSRFLVISVSSDWLYPPYQSEAIVSALTTNEKEVNYCEIKSNFGHDAFLIEGGQLNYIIGRFLSHTIVSDVMATEIPVISENSSIKDAAGIMITRGVNHLPVLDEKGMLTGIVTSWDIAKAVALGIKSLDEIMSRTVITATSDESIETATKKMEEFVISALPVVDKENHVIGLVSSEGLSRLVGQCR